jgi:hypothetical protein
MSQAQATKVLTDQDFDKAKMKKRAASSSFHKTQLYSSTATSQDLQKESESMLQEEIIESEQYSSIRVDETTWWVLRSVPRKIRNDPIVDFERVRVVTIDKNGSMECSCGYTSHFGIPDRHVIHVASHYGENFMGFNSSNVDIRFHNVYCHLVASKDETEMSQDERDLRGKLIQLRELELKVPFAPSICSMEGGPKHAISIDSEGQGNRTYHEVYSRITSTKSQEPAILKYSKAEVASAIRSFVDGSSNAAGFSQSQHNCESWDDDDDGAVLPSFDSPANAACKLPAASKAEAAAVVKELRQAMENSTPTSLANAISRCEELTEELNTRRKLQMGGGAPSKGTIVSGKLRAKSRKRKHEKQY